MKLKRNDLQELEKRGSDAIKAKLSELRLLLEDTGLKQERKLVNDLKSRKMIRRSIAQLKTMQTIQNRKQS